MRSMTLQTLPQSTQNPERVTKLLTAAPKAGRCKFIKTSGGCRRMVVVKEQEVRVEQQKERKQNRKNRVEGFKKVYR